MAIMGALLLNTGDYRYIQHLNYGDSGIATVKIGDYRHIQHLNYGDFRIAITKHW